MTRNTNEIAASIESAGLRLFTDGYGRFTDEPDKIATNIPLLDRMLGGGFEPGLHCLTAGPSSYKSTWLLQVAYLAAMDGKNVAYITSEISAEECRRRLVARKMQVDAMRNGRWE